MSLAFVALACASSRDDRGAASARTPSTREPEHTTLATAVPRGRSVRPLAPASARARTAARRLRDPVVSGLTLPRMTPAAPEGAPTGIVSLTSPALVAPPPAPFSAPTVQGLPAAPQEYGHTMSNFGPTGPILGTSPGMSPPSALGATSGSFAPGGR